MSSAQITLAGPSEIGALQELKAQVARAAFAGLADAEALEDWLGRFCSDTYFAERLETAHTTFLLAGDPATPLGMAALKRREGRAYFGDLYVRRPGTGIGSDLWRARLDLARSEGIAEGVCDVFAPNRRALSFARRNGFRIADGYREQSLGVWVHRLTRGLTVA